LVEPRDCFPGVSGRRLEGAGGQIADDNKLVVATIGTSPAVSVLKAPNYRPRARFRPDFDFLFGLLGQLR